LRFRGSPVCDTLNPGNPIWIEDAWAENDEYYSFGKPTYLRSADGHLMPTKKDQPPDPRHFNPARP